MKNKTIGQLIEDEVRKQQRSITAFADEICCQRNNVYNIFNRNNIDIQLLARISNVLHHNYFQDLAKNPNLADIPKEMTEKEVENQKAVTQFFDVMPNILSRLGMSNCITFDKSDSSCENDIPHPDMILPDYLVCFTIGERWIEKAKMDKSPIFEVISLSATKDTIVDIVENKAYKSTFIDVKLDYKTEQEWEDTMLYIKEHCLQQVKLYRYFY